MARSRRNKPFGRPFDRDWSNMDQSNMETLRMIHAKFTRDYLPFFANLSTMYGNSKRGREIREQILMVNRVRSIIEVALFNGKITGDQSEDLYELVDAIEQRKLDLLEDVKKNQSMREKMTKASETVGVSPADLNITKEMVKAGVKQAGRGSRDQDFLTRLRYEQPGAHERLLRLAEGFKVAGLGPFAPLMDAANDLEKMIRQMFTRGNRDRLGGVDMISPMASQPGEAAQSAPGGRLLGEDASVQLFYFFNTKAYKAKWTKELLDRIKGVANAANTPVAFGGKLLKYLGVATAALVSGKKMLDLVKARDEAKESGTAAVTSSTALGRNIAARDAEVQNIGITAAAEKYGKSERQIIDDASKREYARQFALSSGFKAREPLFAKTPGLRWLIKKTTGYKRPEVQPISEIQKDYERKFNFKPEGATDRELNRMIKVAGEKLEKLSKSVDKLSDNVGKNQTESKPVAIGNPFDSADPLVTQHSTGKLTVGGR